MSQVGEGPVPGSCDVSILRAFDAAEDVPSAPDDRELARFSCDDLGNGRRFLARFGADFRYSAELGWFGWTGKKWCNRTGEMMAQRASHLVAEMIAGEVEALAGEDEKRAKTLRGWARESRSLGRVSAMLKMAQPYLSCLPEEWDPDPFVLAVQNGVLEMRAADDIRLFPHSRKYRNTRLAAAGYDPEADCPRWRQFMAEVLPDEATRRYMQIWLGICCLGDISVQQVMMLSGAGSNGKSTMLEVVAGLLGDYAATVDIASFLHQDRVSGAGPSPDVARLPGVRFVRASEPEPGSRLSEKRIKEITGGESMATRKLHRDFFEFRPQCKLNISFNSKPVLVGKDHGIKRRISIIPFRRQFGVNGAARRPQDVILRELSAEYSGILNWLLDGVRLYLEGAFEPPEEVLAATRAYFDEMDPIGQFIAQCTVREEGDVREAHKDIYLAYKRWCDLDGEVPKSPRAFGLRLNDLGFEKVKTGGVIFRHGIRLLDEWRAFPEG